MGDILPPGVAPVAIEEAKAFLRIVDGSEDALIAGFIRAATGLAEAFTGQALIVRDVAETALVAPTWQRLKTAPCVAIAAIDAFGGATPGPAYESDIDLSGNGWVRIIDPRGSARVTVRYRAGLAADWNGVPEPLRLGIVRLVSHFHAHRDAADAGGPPAAVAALWRPWRRLRLG